jgi:beta-galactosidase
MSLNNFKKKEYMRIAWFIILVFGINHMLFSQRQIKDFNRDWKFHLGHTWDIDKDFGYGTGKALQFAKNEPAPYGSHGIAATLIRFNDQDWKVIQLPHDWTVDLPYDFEQHPSMGGRYGYKVVGREYPETSIGWYRKKFILKKQQEGKRVVVEFDGVFRDCMVWINGFYIGRHWSGYTGFSFDISDYLVYGGENVISVRVDATLHEGWFYEGAGINKEVKLVITDPLHIEDTGPQIVCSVTGKSAIVTVLTKIKNEDFSDHPCSIIHEMMDPDGNIIGRARSTEFDIAQRSDQLSQQQLEVDAPLLWSVETPNRYRLISKIMSGNQCIDSYETPFGIRSIAFDANKGFLLNGERYQINGVCIHQNFAGVGSALPEALHYYRLQLLKEMGVNAVRSHYPFSRSMLNACDSLGMLVMDETRAAGSYAEALDQVKWMVTHHRNHPSVILWSMANEEGGTQRDIIGKRYMKKMVAEAHKYDSTRLVTAGVNAWGNKVDFGFSQVIDVMGFNYSSGFIDAYHKNHPNQPLIGTEVSNATVTRDYYEFSDANKSVAVSDGAGAYYVPEEGEAAKKVQGHIASNLAVNNKSAYDALRFYAEREYLAGSFFWTGFDYNGEIWPSKAPNNSSQFGAMDLCGFPKAMYYYYQSWWTNKPVLHLAQHWNWKGMEGQLTDVLIHSNCDEIELLLNDKSLGKKKMQTYGYLSWKVTYQPGTLKAIGYNNGIKVQQDQLVTTEKPFQIQLIPNKTILKSDGKDVIVIRIELLDEKGNLTALADNQMNFEIIGDARILGTGNGNPSSAEIDSKPKRKALNGRAQVILQAGSRPGKLMLKVSSEGIHDAELVLRQE